MYDIVRNGGHNQDRKQRTALMHAIQGGHGEIAQALLDAARATGKACRLSAMAESLSGGDCRGLSPLHLACDKELPAVVKALLVAGAGVEARDAHGATALLHACRKVTLGRGLISASMLVDLGGGAGRGGGGRANEGATKSGEPFRVIIALLGYEPAQGWKVGRSRDSNGVQRDGNEW